MKKEIFICLAILVLVIISDVIISKCTNKYLDDISIKFEDIKKNIDNNLYASEKISEIESSWNKYFSVLTCFLEHDELEKINTQIVIIQSGIDVEDKEYVYEELDRGIFILEHIKNKERFKIDNIF